MLTPEQVRKAWNDLPDGAFSECKELECFAANIESLVTKEKDKEIERLKCAHSDMAEMYRESQQRVADLEDRLEKARNAALREAANLCKKIYFENYPDADPEYETGEEYQEIMALQSIPATKGGE